MNAEALGNYSAEFEPVSMAYPWEPPPKDYAFGVALLAALLWVLWPMVWKNHWRVWDRRLHKRHGIR